MNDFHVRPLLPQELDAAAALVARCFAPEDAARAAALEQHWRNQRTQQPGFAWDDLRVGLHHGELVALARVERREMLFGRALLRVGILRDVCTAPEVRHQGYSAAIMRDALTILREQGTHLALLRDPDGHYGRYGFVPVMPDYALRFAVANARQLKKAPPLRLAQADDLPALGDLYARHWHSRPTLRRSPELWRWRQARRPHALHVFEEAERLTGYLWCDPLYPERVEALADTPLAARALLRFAAEEAPDTFVEWALPPDDALVIEARALLPVRLSAQYYPASGWMARMIDAERLTFSLLMEGIASGIPGTRAANDLFSVQVHPDRVEIALRLEGSAEACSFSYREFIQVVFGMLRPEMMPQAATLSRGARHLLGLLFPARLAAFAAWDWE